MPAEYPETTGRPRSELRAAEFTVLRQTIATRGTTRMVLASITWAIWAVMAFTQFMFGQLPLASLLPLAVLVGGFEAIHALHAGVERIGRYLQVYYESDSDGPQWETAAMAVGPALPGGGIDPLFTVVFIAAAIVNLLSGVSPPPTWQEWLVLGACHAAFGFRIVRARIAAAKQRAVELESFRALLLRQRDRR